MLKSYWRAACGQAWMHFHCHGFGFIITIYIKKAT